jgi:GTP-binding protein
VGKSSLLNMLAGERVSIVDPTPGVTRDRVSCLARLPHPDAKGPEITVELTDTGGYGVYTAEGARFNEVGADLGTLTKDIERQIAAAVASADVVLFVIDAQAGVTPQDELIARMIRQRVLGAGRGTRGPSGDEGAMEAGQRGEVKVLLVANKTDGPKWEAHAYEAASLGFGEPVPVSARNNYCRRQLVDTLYETVEHLPGAREATSERAPEMKLAILGKRNAGKSTLVNALAGEERVIVSEIAGTTRDAVDVRFEMDGRTFLAIDTAGLRKKKSFADQIEWYAFDRAQHAVERADVILLLLDATEPISQVDEQLAMLAQKSFKPVVIVVNKWDLVEGQPGRSGRPVTPEDYEQYLRKELKGLAIAPITLVSAAAGLNVRETVEVAFELNEQAGQRVGTGVLNRVVRGILEERGPTTKLGTFVKVFYVAQVATHPPTILLIVNNPKLFAPNYERFLLNRLRDDTPVSEVPMRLLVRERKRADLADLLTGEYARQAAAEGRSDYDRLEAALEEMPEDPEAYFEDED